jgi:glucose 1-dehydrogenase
MSRVAVITGVAGGIGRACAAAFAGGGWTVAGIDRIARPEGVPCDHFLQLDVGSFEAGGALSAFFTGIGRVDALVNNAAIQVNRTLEATTDAEWSATLDSNLTGVFVAIRAALPYLKAAHGSIVNVSSVHAIATSPGVAAYASSKGALLALTRATALEVGGAGVRVNAVLPGAIDTPMLHAATGERIDGPGGGADPLAALAARTPLGRIGRPEEIASVVVFLADGQQSGFVTGQAIVADGGVLARLASE